MSKISLQTSDEVYKPAEDSWLLARSLPSLPGTVLEIGTGAGLVAVSLALNHSKVTATDLNPKSIDLAKINARKNNVAIEFLIGNQFDPVSGRKFDYIVCNPPYLPKSSVDYNDKALELAVEGGPTGAEFTIKLVEQTPRYLKENGSLLLLISSRMGDLPKGWNREILAREKYLFEELRVERWSFIG